MPHPSCSLQSHVRTWSQWGEILSEVAFLFQYIHATPISKLSFLAVTEPEEISRENAGA